MQKPYSLLLSAFFIGCLTLASELSCATERDDTHEYKLDNGLTLIVREDHRAPSVLTEIWYKVGGSFEPNGLTGISHLLEHLMFRGTAKYSQADLLRTMAINGGDQNAFTSFDHTAYHQEVDIHQLKLCFEIEADRMNNLLLKQEDFEKELKIVMEERRLRVDDNPESLVQERLFAAAHASNPYHQPVVGWMDDLQNMKLDDVKTWYKNWYGPNNAIVVVVGDVKPDEVYALAKLYFGALKPIEIPKLKPRKELTSLGTRRIQVKANASLPSLYMSYNVPSVITDLESNDPYALLVLLMALDGGESARFAKQLIRDQSLAASISSYYNPFHLYETLLTFFAIPSKDHTVSELEQAFIKQIEKIQKEPISEQELKRIKTNVIAEHIYKQDARDDQAYEIGMLESLGLSWHVGENFPDRIQAIRAEDVQRVALKYLTPERLTIAELIPLKSGT